MAKDRGYAVGALAAQPIDDYDDAVLRQLAHTYSLADPVPEGLVDRLKFAITLDALHAEIAELVRVTDLAGARGGPAAEVQTVTFTSQSVTIMITVTPLTGDTARIDGWAADGAGMAIDLRAASGRFRVVADEDGRFVFEEVPRGMAQFVAHPREGVDLPTVVTPSLEI